MPQTTRNPIHLQAAYAGGLRAEQQVIKHLKAQPSSRDENLNQDIDYRYNGSTVSLKTQHIALRTNNLAFELTGETANGFTEESWYYTGKADYYHFLVGKELYEVKKSDLLDYVSVKGFDYQKSHTNSTRSSQVKLGHRHVNATCGLINIVKLLKAGILVKIAVIH